MMTPHTEPPIDTPMDAAIRWVLSSDAARRPSGHVLAQVAELRATLLDACERFNVDEDRLLSAILGRLV